MSDASDEIDASRAPLMDHLLELRRRLLWCIGALLTGFLIAFTQAQKIFDILVHPLAVAYGPGVGHKLIYTQLYGAFFVQIKVSLFAGFVLAFPVIANQLWAFIAPGLYKREKAAFLPFLIATPMLFTLGASLAYFVVMPPAFRFLLGFQHTGESGISQEALPEVGAYLAIAMQFIIGFGVAFLLPILLMLLERAGIVTRRQLIASRRYAIVGATIIGAILAPPDVWSQVLLAVPLIVLYELSIVGIWFTERRRARDAAQLPAAAE